MKRNMKITLALFITVIMLFLWGGAYAYNPYDDPSIHKGAYCSVCHEKFSINNEEIVKMFPCVKKPCHFVENRGELHLKDYMCENCHAAIAGEYDIHAIHREKANCEICHMSSRGWNSSSVIVPEVKKIVQYEGEVIGVPNKECSFCHKSVENAKNMHDIHAPSGDNACHGCHSSVHDGGDICVSCHNKFSIGENNSCLAECHTMSPDERYSAHLREGICEECHNATLGGSDVHSVHRGEVDCSICHMSPRGWNSSVATVPEPRKTLYYEEEGLVIPRSSECSYCHKTAENPKRAHDVHKPVLEGKCSKCHGVIKNESLAIWGWPTPMQEKEGIGITGQIKNKVSNIFKKKEIPDISCDSCHAELTKDFYSNNQTAWVAELHLWAGNSTEYVDDDGEAAYEKNFIANVNSRSCLLCHVIEKINVYTGEHKIYFRSCDNESCHGPPGGRGTKLFVAAGYAHKNEPHGRISFTGLQKGEEWRACVGCHKVHVTIG